jgi:hypothetical protein
LCSDARPLRTQKAEERAPYEEAKRDGQTSEREEKRVGSKPARLPVDRTGCENRSDEQCEAAAAR